MTSMIMLITDNIDINEDDSFDNEIDNNDSDGDDPDKNDNDDDDVVAHDDNDSNNSDVNNNDNDVASDVDTDEGDDNYDDSDDIDIAEGDLKMNTSLFFYEASSLFSDVSDVFYDSRSKK